MVIEHAKTPASSGWCRQAARGVTLTIESSEDAEDDTVTGDTGTGSAG